MREKLSSEYARATAACVNMAVDCIAAELERELITAAGDTARALRRVLRIVNQQRIGGVNENEGIELQ
jgi:hypothetical protein